MIKNLKIYFCIVICTPIVIAAPLGICETKNKRPITLTYKNDDTLVIDGKYTAKMYDSDIFDMDGKTISFVAYSNKKYHFWVEKIDEKDQLTVIPAKYVHGLAVDSDRTEIVYSCKWYK